ncbi:MAG: hypothetical protein NXH95_01260 [Pseudomonadaceae bacterium]|nr:hypothetical protein [Pseudomonadaceae bacterium]
MTQEVDDLLVRIDATTEMLRREMKKAEKQTDSSVSKIERSTRRVDKRFEAIGKSARVAKTALAAVFGGVLISRVSSFAKSQTDLADRIGKSAIVAGVTTDQIQELRAAFGELAGTNDNEVDQSLRRFNRRLGEARKGNQEYLKTFKELQVELTDASGFRSTSEVLEDSLRALSNVQDSAVRASQASKIFGEDAGPRLAAALGGGITALEEVRKQLRDDGGIISADNIKKAEAYNDELARIERVLTARSAQTILDNAEAIIELNKAFAAAKDLGIDILGGLVKGIQQGSEDIAAAVGGIADTDIPRLEKELTRIQDQINQVLGSNLSTSLKDSSLAKLGAEEQLILKRIELAKSRLKKEEEGGGSGSGDDDDDDDSGVLADNVGPFQGPEAPFLKSFQGPSAPTSEDSFGQGTAAVEEVKAMFAASRTEMEQIEAQIARVKELAAGGFFEISGVDDQEILERLNIQMEKLKEDTEESSAVIGEALANNIGGAIDEMFAGGEVSVQNFAEAMLRDLARITVQLLIMKPLIEGIFGAGGGAGSFGQGLFKAFGFNTGGSFTVGGKPGPDANFVPLALTRGERVDITPAGKAKEQQAPTIIINSPPGVTSSVRTEGPPGNLRFQIDQMIEQKISKDVSDGGRIARTLENRYGLRR